MKVGLPGQGGELAVKEGFQYLEAMPLPSVVLDSSLTVRYANPAFFKWVKSGVDDVSGRRFGDLVDAWQDSELVHWVNFHASSKRPGKRVCRDPRDSSYHEVSVIIGPDWTQIVAFPCEVPTHAFVQATPDHVAEGRLLQVQTELEETHSRLQMAVDAARIGIWVRKHPSNVFQTNRHGLAHFGIFDQRDVSAAENVGCITTIEMPHLFRVPDGLFPSEPDVDSIHRIQGSDGRIRWIRAVASVVHGESGVSQVFQGLTMDVTDQLARESDLERKVDDRTRELHDALRESESFAYSVSHDLRSPLRSIIATSRILEEDYALELTPSASLLLDRQANAAKRLADIIDALLTFSRLGRQEMKRTQLDISTLVKEVAEDLPFRHPSNKVVIEPNLEANGDPRLVRLVFQNLLENAFKFSPEGGVIEVGQLQENDHKPFFVKDHGVGFDMLYVEKLFEPFQRLHTEEAFPGTGIGLANVRRIIERHNGRIWATSEPGIGSTFLFTLA